MNIIKKNLMLASVAALVLIGAGVTLVNQNTPKASPAKTENKQVLSSQAKKVVATVVVKSDSKESKYDLDKGVGETALDVTKLATSDIKMTGQGENAFITSINGREASTAKKEFWELRINGKSSDVGAGSYIVKEGDVISWQIATY